MQNGSKYKVPEIRITSVCLEMSQEPEQPEPRIEIRSESYKQEPDHIGFGRLWVRYSECAGEPQEQDSVVDSFINFKACSGFCLQNSLQKDEKQRHELGGYGKSLNKGPQYFKLGGGKETTDSWIWGILGY